MLASISAAVAREFSFAWPLDALASLPFASVTDTTAIESASVELARCEGSPRARASARAMSTEVTRAATFDSTCAAACHVLGGWHALSGRAENGRGWEEVGA